MISHQINPNQKKINIQLFKNCNLDIKKNLSINTVFQLINKIFNIKLKIKCQSTT